MLDVKKMLDKLWMIFAVVGVASAMDIAPFYFENASGLDPKSQEAEWDYLMKYKMFGASGIKFENGDIRVTDSVGWFGTSHGDFTLQNGGDVVGGPILIGGNLDIKMGPELFANGPVNVTGNIVVGQETNFASKPNEFHGHQCVYGDVPNVYAALIGDEYRHFGVEGKTSVNSNYGYNDCFDTTKGLKVPEVRNNLYMPTLSVNPTYSTQLKTRVTNLNTGEVVEQTGAVSAVEVNNMVYEIYVPEGDSKEPFDIYLDHITLTNDATLLFNMQNGGRLTRIFLENGISFSSQTNIAVQYDTLDNGTYIRQDNEDYNGTLLFYTTEDIMFQSTNQNSHPSLQGSILTTGTITINDHIKLAGQLLANMIRINFNFDGSNFIFVPFNPVTLTFDPTALAEGSFIENNQTVLVPIKLDSLSSVDVSFKYCFDIKDSSLTDSASKIASIQDFNGISHVCGVDTGSVKILEGDTVPHGIYEVYINVAIDTLFEGKEKLPMKVFGLAGAVLPGNKRQGYFELPIIDDPTPASLKKIVLDSVPENSPVGTRIDSLVAIRGDKFCTHCKFALVDSTDYVNVSETGLVTVKDSTILDYETITEIKIRVFVIDTLYQKTSDTTVTIPVINVNEDPILDKQEFDIVEHMPPNTRVDSMTWDDKDLADKFRKDEFEAIGGATDVFTVSPTGVIATKKELDYETMDTTYILVVKLKDSSDPTLFDIDTMVIHVHNVNEPPTITTDSLHVTENSKKGTIVGVVESKDPDIGDSKSFTLVKDESGCLEVAPDGTVSVKKSDCLDREKTPVVYITVKVTDAGGLSHTKNIAVVVDDVPGPTIDIVEASNEDTTWKYPEIIYTNRDSLNVCWEVNMVRQPCADTTLKPGINRICKEVCDVDGFEGCAQDCFTAYYSDISPVVTVSAANDANLASNIYTIVERPADSDTNVYVKDTVSRITVTVTDKDPIDGDTTYSFTIPVDLTRKVNVPQTTYDALSAVANQTVALDVLHANTTSTPINGNSVLNTYPTKVAGVEVTVSYVTDNKGNVVKQAVVNEKGKVDSIEVITVSYQTVVDGQIVTISYQADAETGKALYVDGNGGFIASKNADRSSGIFKVSYNYVDKKTNNSVELTYVVDRKGNMVKNPDGDRGYQVSYTYVDKYGNAAKQAVFVVLDQTLPVVEILSPVDKQVIRSNSVKVEWTIDGVKQDTLVLQGLDKGPNVIVRFYKDKAGNEASDTVYVIMKDSKDIDISVEQPVTVVTKDKVDEYYAVNPPKKGQTFAVSIRNPSTEEEVETLIGGDFETQDGSGEDPYPGVKSSKHLGPTLALDVKLPTVSGVTGLATLDDLILPNGKISNKGIGVDTTGLDDAAKADYREYSVEEYISEFCERGTPVPAPGGYSQFNLYDITLKTRVWVYTSLGNYVNDVGFTQELNDPNFTDDAGLTQMFLELKPDRDGYVHAKNKKLMATGAYVYKVDAKLTNHLRCAIPPFDGANAKVAGDTFSSNDELLKPFGYKRPAHKKKK